MSMVSELVGHEVVTIKTTDLTANPAPLGLMGFGMTTVLLNLHNAGLFSLGSMILAMGIFYGGIAQVIAGILEWKKGNTFGTTAFISYGFFWMTLVGLLVLPKMGLVEAPENSAMVAWLTIWGIFTAILFVGTLKLNRSLQFIFASLVVLFFLLAIGDAMDSALIKTIAGYEGIICGASAIYAAAAQIINETHGRDVLPL
ncbi:acetate uptake transporter [Teredinibacter purpureus]|uniref:acetate uptake transporter n=1 Tax=Teredinibacter purpureus TaxID=2731756 RepID=UPI000AED0E95|nr:acetate uptake transporter [Teredinibacter purpureus]